MVRRKRTVAQKQRVFWSWLRVPLTAARKKSIVDNLMYELDMNGYMSDLDLRRKKDQHGIDKFLKEQIVTWLRPLRHRFDRQPVEMLRRLRMLISQSRRDYGKAERRPVSPWDRERRARDELVYVYASESYEDLQRPLSFLLSAVSTVPAHVKSLYGGWVPYDDLEFTEFENCLWSLNYDSASQDIYCHIPDLDDPGEKKVVHSLETLKAALVVMQVRRLPMEFYLGPRGSASSTNPQHPSGPGRCVPETPSPRREGTPSSSPGSGSTVQDSESVDNAPADTPPPQTPTVSDMINEWAFKHWANPSVRPNLVANDIISVATQDIATLQVNCIVNGISNPRGGNGLDQAVHRAAGPGLRAACEDLGPCQIGEVQSTDGYDLPCQTVIHTVSPAWDGADLDASRERLGAVYRRCMEVALEKRVRTIAFPAISTGSKGFPSTRAAVVALQTVREFLDEPDHLLQFDRIVFCNIHQTDIQAYRIFIGQFFPGPTAQGTQLQDSSITSV